MVNYPTILNLPQEDINRQLYEMILKLQKENAGEGTDISNIKDDIDDINDAIGTETESGTILYRIKALETANAGTT